MKNIKPAVYAYGARPQTVFDKVKARVGAVQCRRTGMSQTRAMFSPCRNHVVLKPRSRCNRRGSEYRLMREEVARGSVRGRW